ncbi:MAG: hypothetical protein RMJ56_12005 [Gemmataceae bacterium]|nr:hypothetical protein [Gemmata sp.]MDW8198315.1 hypothetical protein [Gemmataceae bacterium]
MPSWPTQSDYKDALQNPDSAFRDPDLRFSQAERSPMGVPRARSGAFASVYKMIGPKGVLALKLFNFPNDERARRYQAVSDYLERQLGPKKPACLVRFQYHLEGIRVGRAWYPTLTMPWVKGVTLGEWVRQTVERKVPDVAAVRRMADQWGTLIQQLQEVKIAHGDLQHDNVMVVNDALVLVDYDGMCVPALDPPPPTPKLDQLEFGKPAYQHPDRANQPLSCELDHFAAWIILIALRAIAAEPRLYVEYILKPDNENLLFTPHDLTAPASSRLWADLLRSPDAEVVAWSRQLRASLDQPFDKIPRFTLDPFDQLRRLVAAVPRDWAQIEAESERLRRAGKPLPPDLQARADPVQALQELCAARHKDWPAILATGESLLARRKALPSDLLKALTEARQRVRAREALQQAVASRDPRAIVAAYRPELVDSWVEPTLLVSARAAAGQVAWLEKLKAAVASPGDGRGLVALWQQAAPVLAGVPEAITYQQAAESWQARLQAANDFLRVYEKSPQKERELAHAWSAVLAAGPPHPSLTRLHRKRGEDALRWAPLLDQLRALPKIASYETDQQLVELWGTGAALAGCAEAAEFASRVQDAKGRLALVQALEQAIQAADAGGSEEAVVSAAAQIPPSYRHPYVTRVREGSEAVTLLMALHKAIDHPQPSDRAIAAAYEQLQSRHPRLARRLEKVNARLYHEAEAAIARRNLLDQFAQIDKTERRLDKQDEKWLNLWKQHGKLLADRRDREELRSRLTLARDRLSAWNKLAHALAQRDIFVVRRLLSSVAPLLADYPPYLEHHDEIATLIAKADQVVAIQHKLAAGQRLSSDDLKFLRHNPQVFGANARKAVERQVRARLAGEERLSPVYPAYQVAGSRGGLIKACWAWGGHELITYCLVAVDGRRFLTDPNQADMFHRLKCLAENHQREGGGITLVPPPGAAQAYVTVWPVVELGWTTIYGPALPIGPVPVGGMVSPSRQL